MTALALQTVIKPAPTGTPAFWRLRWTCGSGFTREHRQSQCPAAL